MTTSLWHRRRADRFAQLLDEADGARRHRVRSRHDEELTTLVELRQQLVELPAPEIDPEFRAGLRAMLVATAEREGIGVTAAPEPAPTGLPRRASRPRPRAALVRGPRARSAVIAGVAAGAVAFGMSNASANAVPGDALYGVKRSTERAQLALASSEVGRAQLYLDFARTRLTEAQTVSSDLGRVLNDMDRDTTAGVSLLTTAAANRRDLAALDVVDSFVVEQRDALDELAGAVDRTDRARVATSLVLLDTIDRRATDLRRSLDDQCPTATSVDTLGPLPVTCLTAPAPGALGPRPQPGSGGPQSQPGGGPEPAAGEGQRETQPEAPSHHRDDPRTPGSTSSTDQGTSSGTSSGTSPGTSSGTSQTDSAAPSDTEPGTDHEDAEPTDDGGLLNSLNKVLGNLLGG